MDFEIPEGLPQGSLFLEQLYPAVVDYKQKK